MTARSFASLPRSVYGGKEQKGEPHQDSGMRAGCMRMLAGQVWDRDMGRSVLSLLAKIGDNGSHQTDKLPPPKPCRVAFKGLQKKEGNVSSQV